MKIDIENRCSLVISCILVLYCFTRVSGAASGETRMGIAYLAGAGSTESLLETRDGILYAGTSPYGAVFKSDSDGTTWNETSELSGASIIHCLLESDDGSIFAGTDVGIFKTDDSGAIWKNLSDGEGSHTCKDLLRSSDGSILAAINFKDYMNVQYCVISRSRDNGKTWKGVLIGLGSFNDIVQSVDGDFYCSQTYFYRSPLFRGRVWKSSAAGDDWELVLSNDKLHHVGALLASSNGDIYASGSWSKQDYPFEHRKNILLKSRDRGDSWEIIADVPGGSVTYFMEASTYAICAGTDSEGAVYVSSDSGKSWRNVIELDSVSEVNCFLQKRDGSILAGTGNTNAAVHRFSSRMNLSVDNDMPSPGEAVSISFSMMPIRYTVDAYAVIESPEKDYSIVSGYRNRIVSGLQPFKTNIDGILRIDNITLLHIPAIPLNLEKGEYSLVVGLVPAGLSLGELKDFIPLYWARRSIIVQ